MQVGRKETFDTRFGSADKRFGWTVTVIIDLDVADSNGDRLLEDDI